MPAQNASDDPKWLQSASHDFQAACAGDSPFRVAYIAGLRADGNANADANHGAFACSYAHANANGNTSTNCGA